MTFKRLPRLFQALVLFTLAACGGGSGGPAPVASGGGSQTPPANQPPQARIQADALLVPGKNMKLSGRLSSDPEGSALSYQWSVLRAPAGHSASVNPAQAMEPELVATQGGRYEIQLTVSDGQLSHSATQTVVVDRPPVAKVKSAIGAVVGKPVVLDATVSEDPDGDALSYQWSLEEKPTGSQAQWAATDGTATFTADREGLYGFRVVVQDGHLQASQLARIQVVKPPEAVITAAGSAPTNTSLRLSGFSSRSYLHTIAYRWTLVSKPAHSLAQIKRPDDMLADLPLDLVGSYTVQLVVLDGGGNASAPAQLEIRAISERPEHPSAPQVVLPGAPITPRLEVQLRATAADPQGSSLQYRWQFADGLTAEGPNLTRSFPSPGSYGLTLSATNAKGLTAQSQSVITVAEPITTLQALCEGSACAASSSNLYAGKGVGVWQHHNRSPHHQAVSFSIQQVPAERTAHLMLTNLNPFDIERSHSWGSPLGSAGSSRAGLATGPAAWPASQAPARQGKAQLMAQNEALLRRWARAGQSATPASASPRHGGRTQSANVPLNTLRTWNGFMGEKAPYETTAQAQCTLNTGRPVVFWVDKKAWDSGSFNAAALSSVSEFACGPRGALQRLFKLAGQPWGAHPLDAMISDEPLQPLNVLLVDPGQVVSWGGYWAAHNQLKRSVQADSNEALAVYLNLQRSRNNLMNFKSYLVHEFMHMVNGYQRGVNQQQYHAPWLEETTAMMAEDLAAPASNLDANGLPYSAVLAERTAQYPMGYHNAYVNAGVGLDLYRAGGSLSTYLNRRHGSQVFKRLLLPCEGKADSFACLDAAIRQSGGQGFASAFTRMVASLLGGVPALTAPDGFGFPAVQEDDIALPGFDPATATPPTEGYRQDSTLPFYSTSSGLLTLKPASNNGLLSRQHIVLPPGTALTVVVH